MTDLASEMLELTRRLLNAIGARDWDSYVGLCDPGLTCVEPESAGEVVHGLEFHRFYFDHGGHLGSHANTIVTPHVWTLGPDAAIISYVRLVQRTDESGSPTTARMTETRVWRRQAGEWKHVHFHRSAG